MIQKIDELLMQAKDLLASGKYNDADEILKPLRQQYPLSQDVARLWCSLALRTNRAAAGPAYAEQIYGHVQSDFHKAHWAHVLGTAYFILLDLTTAQTYLSRALEHLIALVKTGKIPPHRKKDKLTSTNENVFASGEAEKLLWKTCAHLANNGIKAFPNADTLLGLVRDVKLLDFDKDLDIAVWMDSWQACCTTLESAGWVRQTMRIDYANYRDYVHPQLGITLDVCGLQPRGQQLVGGFSLPDYPADYQRVSEFPHFEVVQRDTEYGAVWFPQQPDIILRAFYGDWRTPNSNWDTVVSAQNLESFTLLVRCYAYHRLAQHWLLGDLAKAWCYAYQVILKDPDDILMLRCRQWTTDTLKGARERMQRLISRLSSPGKKLDFALSDCDLRETLLNLSEEMKLSAQHKVEVLFDIDDFPPVKGNSEKLRSVLSNLIINAIEAMPNGGQLRFSSSVDDETCSLIVQDSGVGMTSEFIRDRLFRPFQTSKPSGLGIGLFQSRELVEQMGGTLTVQSRAGEGSSFKLKLKRV